MVYVTINSSIQVPMLLLIVSHNAPDSYMLLAYNVPNSFVTINSNIQYT